MSKPKRNLRIVDKFERQRSYFERDPDKWCSACGRSWADHTDYEWSMGCLQKKS